MKIDQARQLTPGQDVVVSGKPARFVALHSENHTPGRYSWRALIDRHEAGRIRQVSVKVAAITLPA